MAAFLSAGAPGSGPLWAQWCPACGCTLQPITTLAWRERWYRCTGCHAAYSPAELRRE